MLFYNSTLSLPMLLLAVLAQGEHLLLPSYPLLFNRQARRRCLEGGASWLLGDGVPAAAAALSVGLLRRRWPAAAWHCSLLVRSHLSPRSTCPGLLPCPQFQLVLLLASALGLTINHSTFVCTRVNEPLMTSVAGACGAANPKHALSKPKALAGCCVGWAPDLRCPAAPAVKAPRVLDPRRDVHTLTRSALPRPNRVPRSALHRAQAT